MPEPVMTRLHFACADLDEHAACRFRFQLDQGRGRAAQVAIDVPPVFGPDGTLDVGGTFARARIELIAVLSGSPDEAQHLTHALAPDRFQALPSGQTVIDLRAVAADD